MGSQPPEANIQFQGPNPCEIITCTFPELSSEAAVQLLCAFDGDVHAAVVSYARSKELREQRKQACEQARIRELRHQHELNQYRQLQIARRQQQQQQQLRRQRQYQMSPLHFYEM